MATVATSSKNVSDCARRVLKDMGEWRIAPSPENYHVWFVHLSGQNTNLSQAIAQKVETEESFSDQVMSELYADFVANEKEAMMLRHAQNETQLLLKEVIKEVISAGAVTSEYNVSLEKYAHELAKAQSLKDVHEIIVGLLMSTADITQESVELQKRLEETTAQAETLQQQLVQASEEATRDTMTGLQNRHAADKALLELKERYAKTGETFSIVLLDIDKFKRFNDNYGHLVGDAVLAKVASVLRDNLKGRDLPARYGGEEFIVILPSTPLSAADAVAGQLCEAIANQRLKIAQTSESVGSVTASFGVATIRTGDTVDALVERADKALYLAKDSGRNNVKSENDL